MSLPYFQTSLPELSRLQTTWASQLNPMITNPIVNGLQLSNVALKNGSTVINHKLSRMQQGWIVTDINGAAEIYRSAPLNSSTLTLTSTAAVMVNLWVY